MSWKSGSSLMSDIIRCLRGRLDRATRFGVYIDLIELFETQDCDTLMDCMEYDEAFASAYRWVHREVKE